MHTFLDIYGYAYKEFAKGAKFISKLLEKIIDGFGKEYFDYILVFSDHRFRCEGLTREHLLDKDRVKTLMYVRKKHDRQLSIGRLFQIIAYRGWNVQDSGTVRMI